MLIDFHRKKGSALIVAMLVAISIGSLALTYFRFVRMMAFNKGQIVSPNKLAKELNLTALQEAVNFMIRGSYKPRSNVYWILKGGTGKKNNIPLPFTDLCSNKFLPKGYISESKADVSIFDLTKLSYKGIKYNGSYETQGIFVVRAQTIVYKKNGPSKIPVGNHFSEEYHDFVIASVIPVGAYGSKLSRAFVAVNMQNMGQNLSQGYEAKLAIIDDKYANTPSITDMQNFYEDYELWFKKNLSFKDMKDQKIVDENEHVINLNGIVHCKDDVLLNGDWVAKGQGVLIADSFCINGAIKKENYDTICVLYARKGNVTINTPKEINAAVIAVNKNKDGSVIANDILDLKGAVIVDKIDLNLWKKGIHRIQYDNIFRKTEYIYRISISKWLNYARDINKNVKQ